MGLVVAWLQRDGPRIARYLAKDLLDAAIGCDLAGQRGALHPIEPEPAPSLSPLAPGKQVPDAIDLRIGHRFDRPRLRGNAGCIGIVDVNDEAVSDFEDSHARGETSQLIGVTGASPDLLGNGREDWIDQQYDRARRGVTEGIRYGAGSVGRWGDHAMDKVNDMMGSEQEGATPRISRGINDVTTHGGRDVLSTAHMERYKELAAKYEAIAIGLAEMRGADGEFMDVSEVVEKVRKGIDDDYDLPKVLSHQLKELFNWTIESRRRASA